MTQATEFNGVEGLFRLEPSWRDFPPSEIESLSSGVDTDLAATEATAETNLAASASRTTTSRQRRAFIAWWAMNRRT